MNKKTIKAPVILQHYIKRVKNLELHLKFNNNDSDAKAKLNTFRALMVKIKTKLQKKYKIDNSNE